MKPKSYLWVGFLSLCVCSAAFAQNAEKFCAERHAAKGIACAQCHGENNEITTPDINQCTKCHEPAALAERTKNVKPQNPHSSPHYGNTLECTLCHVQHAAPENYCNQCHSFDFKEK